MKALLLIIFLIISCSSNMPVGSFERINRDVEWFTAALLDRRVDTVIEHFQKRDVKNPVRESLQLFKREAEFFEIWNTRKELDFSIKEKDGEIIAKAELPSGKSLKMIWIDNAWFYLDFGSPD